MPNINDIITNVIYNIVPDIFYIVLFFMQDCVCLVAPYPFRSEPFDEFNITHDFDIMGAGDVWYARPQLVLGRVPLTPCYLNGNTSNTIPYRYRGAIPAEAAADSRPDSGTRSRLFEINIWMWRYGRTFPREVSVADAVAMRKERVQESRRLAVATMERRRAQALVLLQLTQY